MNETPSRLVDSRSNISLFTMVSLGGMRNLGIDSHKTAGIAQNLPRSMRLQLSQGQQNTKTECSLWWNGHFTTRDAFDERLSKLSRGHVGAAGSGCVIGA